MSLKFSRLFASFLSMFCPAAFFCASGQGIVDSINACGHITVNQPAALNARLLPHADASLFINDTPTAVKVRPGYRVQVFDDNNVRTAQKEAQKCKQTIEAEMPSLPVYVTFNSPYWRVKVGDFKTKAEAEAAIADLKNAFPSMSKSLRIVRDRINMTH